jgi:hypothetical protein
MNIISRLLVVVFVVVSFSVGCKTPGGPQPNGPSAGVDGGVSAAGGSSGNVTVDCLKDAGQGAIADAVGRINTSIAAGLNAGSAEAIILKNLEGLAVDVAPAVLACAYQYVASKIHFDASKSTSPEDAVLREKKATIARDYISAHGYKYASP